MLTSVVCPCCSNTLTVSRAPYDQDEPDYPNGRNRLECRTCPYQFLLDKRYYERKEMKRKEVEDVIGGKGSWDNVDQTDGRFTICTLEESETRKLWKPSCRPYALLLTRLESPAQCPSAECEGARAFYYQVQIRSADEPMTTFLKVNTLALFARNLRPWITDWAHAGLVHDMWNTVERELEDRVFHFVVVK